MVLLAAWCAMRFGELAELRRSDIDVKAGVVHVRRGVVRTDDGLKVKGPKSDAGKRDVNIPPHLMPAVKAHLAEHVAASRDALMFSAAAGGHMAPSSLYAAYHPARDLAGRPDLRFTTCGTPGGARCGHRSHAGRADGPARALHSQRGDAVPARRRRPRQGDRRSTVQARRWRHRHADQRRQVSQAEGGAGRRVAHHPRHHQSAPGGCVSTRAPGPDRKGACGYVTSNLQPPRQCDACRQGVHCFGPRCDCCRREPEVVRHDEGGWISGPSLSPVDTIGQFLRLYGDRWSLTEDPELAVYVAVHRPTPPPSMCWRPTRSGSWPPRWPLPSSRAETTNDDCPPRLPELRAPQRAGGTAPLAVHRPAHDR